MANSKVLVRCRRDRGIWRAGLFWGPNWVEAELSGEKLLLVNAEKWLEVRKPSKDIDAVKVENAQPDPIKVEESKPVLFENPKLRKRQEELLAKKTKVDAARAKVTAERDLSSDADELDQLINS